jgi:stage V sporulation protein SpoVS
MTYTNTDSTFTNPVLTDRECATVDGIIAAIKEVAMAKPHLNDSGEPFSHEPGVAELDVAIQTLASLALAVIRHGALAGGASS